MKSMLKSKIELQILSLDLILWQKSDNNSSLWLCRRFMINPSNKHPNFLAMVVNLGQQRGVAGPKNTIVGWLLYRKYR